MESIFIDLALGAIHKLHETWGRGSKIVLRNSEKQGNVKKALQKVGGGISDEGGCYVIYGWPSSLLKLKILLNFDYYHKQSLFFFFLFPLISQCSGLNDCAFEKLHGEKSRDLSLLRSENSVNSWNTPDS